MIINNNEYKFCFCYDRSILICRKKDLNSLKAYPTTNDLSINWNFSEEWDDNDLGKNMACKKSKY